MNLWLALDYLRAERMIQKHSKTFYKAFSQLPNPSQRRGIYAVYAYCRLVDDAIDEHHSLPLLHTYKSNLDRLVKGEKPRGFLWNVLGDTTTLFQFEENDFKPFYELIEGQEFDAAPVSIQTLVQLYHYCDLVATSVGRILLPILQPKPNADHDAFAVALGRAFQITNIVRDVGEDRRRDRIYLPKDRMNHYGYSREDLWNDVNNEAFKNVIKELIQRARDYYIQAEDRLSHFDADVRFPLQASLVFYRAILEEIETHDYNVFNKKHYVSSERKKALIASLLQEKNLR